MSAPSFVAGLVAGAATVLVAALSLLAYLSLGAPDAPRQPAPGGRVPPLLPEYERVGP